jgi:hypothetical protein
LGVDLNSDVEPDPPLTPAQRSKVLALTEEQLEAIDRALLSNVVAEWQKVALIVGATMSELQSRVVGIPDIYYAERLRELVRNGTIEVQGDLHAMRFSEVRIFQPGAPA